MSLPNVDVRQLIKLPEPYLGRRVRVIGRSSGMADRFGWLPMQLDSDLYDSRVENGVMIKYPRIRTFILSKGGAAFPDGDNVEVDGIFAETREYGFCYALLDISRVALRLTDGSIHECDISGEQLPDEAYIRDIVEHIPVHRIPEAIAKVLSGYRYL